MTISRTESSLNSESSNVFGLIPLNILSQPLFVFAPAYQIMWSPSHLAIGQEVLNAEVAPQQSAKIMLYATEKVSPKSSPEEQKSSNK